MTIRPTCVLLALALALPLAAQDLPPVTPRSVPTPPKIAGMKPGEAKQAVDTFATRMTWSIRGRSRLPKRPWTSFTRC
jgi:hypothetical protein